MEFRKVQLTKLKEGIVKYEQEFVDAMDFDLGKGPGGKNEVMGSVGAVAYDLANIDTFVKNREVATAEHLKPG